MSKIEIVEKEFDILVDDWKNDTTYTEWEIPYNNLLVYKPYKEIKSSLREIFDISLSEITYFHNNCHIEVRWQRDRETPWKPLCFCNITIVWMEENVKKIESILEEKLPWIGQYWKEK